MRRTTDSPSYLGHFVSWDSGCLFIGRGVGVVSLHAHYAIQIAFGGTPGIRFRPDDGAPWTAYAGAIIPSRHPHAMDASDAQPSVVVFVEPETREGRALAERWLRGGITALPEALLAETAPAIVAAWEEGRGTAAIEAAARRLVRALAGGMEPSLVVDERILRAVAHIRAHLDAPLTLDAVADVACLSPSRFRHLFVAQTGMALRPYILWRRLLRVWELLVEGVSLSAAAHAAGFADAAHLSRTSRTMFGLAPSAMRMGGLPTAGASRLDPSTGERSAAERSAADASGVGPSVAALR